MGSTENLTLTEGGKAVLNDLLSSLNGPLQAHLDEAASEIREEMAKNSGTNASLGIAEDGRFRVTLNYSDNGKNVSAAVTVDDEATAVKICRNWKKNCSKVSEDLLKNLLEE